MSRFARLLSATALLWLLATAASADVLHYISITDTRFPPNDPPSATWTLSDTYGDTPLNSWIVYTGDDSWSTITSSGTLPDGVAYPYGQTYTVSSGIGTVQAVVDTPLYDEYTNPQRTAFVELNVQSLDTSSAQTMELGLTDGANEVKWDEAAGTISGSRSGLSGDDVTGISRWSSLGSLPLHIQYYYQFNDHVLTFIVLDDVGNKLYTVSWQGSVNPFENFYGSVAVPGGTDPNNLMVYPFVFCEAACQTKLVKTEYLNCNTASGAVDVNNCQSPNESVITASAGSGGSVSPIKAVVITGNQAVISVTPDTGYHIDSVSGCGGSLLGTLYTTGAVSADCTVSATFAVGSSSTSTTTSTSSSSGGGGGGALGPWALFGLLLLGIPALAVRRRRTG
ncbi:MAG: hypothetical protein P8Y64_07210 [Gammaproteobacteria bacterium]|jgi:hypothetical protein